MKILYYIIHSISINQNTYFDVSNKYRNCLKLSSILLINETRWIVGLRPASLLGLRLPNKLGEFVACGHTEKKFFDMCGHPDPKFLDVCGHT